MLVLCVILGIGVLATLAGLILSLLVAIYAGFLVASVALVGIIAALLSSKKLHKEHSALQAAHPGLQPEQWLLDAQGYASRHNGYVQLLTEYNRRLEDLSRRQQLLQKQIETFTGEGTLEQRLQQWNDALSCKKQLDEATNRKETLEQHLQALVAMARPVDPPACPDQLTQTMAETTQELAAARMELQQVQQQLHQCRGRAEAMGQEAVLRSRLDATLRRISRLEDTYHALELAQEALYQATHTLQQRFAPRISKRAQELFSLLTGGRYDRLTLSEDFSLNVSATDEDTLHGAQWRSDGTADQLYLALRLAVAEALTPEAPLVLDDALLRFDDTRLQNTMELLKEEAGNKQIILFTCQSRELHLIFGGIHHGTS